MTPNDIATLATRIAEEEIGGPPPRCTGHKADRYTAAYNAVVKAAAALSPQGLDAKEGGASCDGVGWVFFNEDAGEEYAPNHPVESGEVPDATRIRRSTAQEDVLWNAFQGEFQRAHALETATPSQRLDAATVERCAIRDYLTACAAVADTQAERFSGHDASIVAACRAEAKAYRNAARMIEAQDHASRREQITDTLATEPHQHGGSNG